LLTAYLFFFLRSSAGIIEFAAERSVVLCETACRHQGNIKDLGKKQGTRREKLILGLLLHAASNSLIKQFLGPIRRERGRSLEPLSIPVPLRISGAFWPGLSEVHTDGVMKA
jgi:hypothetical protein